MMDHAHDLGAVRGATERLLDAAGELDNASVAKASRLPGWTRGHVLAHLSRNADALGNVLRGLPMYASSETRDADIADGASRSAAEQLTDLRESAGRFLAVAAEPADWSRTVTLRNGVTDSAARVPFRRWVELELHHVDLDVGYELEDLPAEFVTREIAFLTERFLGDQEVPATALTDRDGRTWSTGGGPPGALVTVQGSAVELLGWLCGRRDGSSLTVAGGPLPALPPL
ncbi:maleylpyruvate isomerase family mycothiol-dependent enzyme [Streptomyces sp. NPDC091649]|uniref:maleylpyruvate isomerase family mycothiol-dependent enzyme n=1 Tax=Streptomyces sp. NPDC091649 TaxID=3366004 RepID=UPI00382822A6